MLPCQSTSKSMDDRAGVSSMKRPTIALEVLDVNAPLLNCQRPLV